MVAPYTSIFDGPTIITRKDFCDILNLDTSRPELKFSASEIEGAYRRRAFRFHPDRQLGKNPPIPTSLCNILMHDIVLARDYMLQGKDNIPGKASVENSFRVNPNDWLGTIISALNNIQSSTAGISSTVPWISFFSNNFLIILLLSTFSEDKLNFRFVNVFSKELETIRPYLKNIDDTALTHFLCQIKEALKTTDQLDAVTIGTLLKEIFPEELIKNEKFNKLVVAIQTTSKELKEMLTDSFIDNLQHIIHFWPNFIATLPSWKHIIGVYFISQLFTSTSLPKYFNAAKTTAEIIWEQKSTAALVLTSLPLFVLTAALLPVNIAMQIGIQFAWIALKAALQILINSFKFLYAAINIVGSLFNTDSSFSHHVFTLFESTLNLTVRLAFNTAVELLDEMIFMLSNQSMLRSFQNTFNSRLDSMIGSLRFGQEQQLVLVTASQDKVERPIETQESTQAFGFFENRNTSLPREDVWLTQLLESIAAQNDEIHIEASLT